MENRLERAGFMGCEEAAAKFWERLSFRSGREGESGQFFWGRFVSACERMGATKRVGARRLCVGMAILGLGVISEVYSI
jgi:hypothetical protein